MDTFKEILKDEYKSRRKRNPSYSLRAFARDLNISHSILSRYFNKNKSLSIVQSVKIGEKIKLHKEVLIDCILLELRAKISKDYFGHVSEKEKK